MGMQEALESAGFTIVGSRAPADICIINTCTVTGKTDRRSRQAARQATRINPDAKIIITGCGAQRDVREFSEIPGVMAVLGNREKQQIAGYVRKILDGRPPFIEVSDLDHAPFKKLAISRFRNYTRAFIKIQEGCNRACTYCVIPSVRGPSRSQPMEQIVSEIQRLTARNFREIVLTGIDLGTYGLDLTPPVNLIRLVDRIERIEGLERIRLSSIEPMEFSDALIQKITESPRICRHFHIPLQSGHNRILQRMNRGYTRDDFARIVGKIKAGSPDACIGVDVITAFPGETHEEFADSYAFIESLPVDYLHVFTYSVRPQTPASRYPDRVDPETARERCHALRALSVEKAERFRLRMTGKILPVIILGARDTRTGFPRALSDNYIQLLMKGDVPGKGSIVDARLERCSGLRCFGRITGHRSEEASQ